MKIKWESNSRAKALADDGKIDREDIIKRTTTDNFPLETATVRLHRVRDKIPYVTLHIRGKAKGRTNYAGNTYTYAPTCRVNMGGMYSPETMDSNGELGADLTWLDVHNLVTRVKEALEIE